MNVTVIFQRIFTEHANKLNGIFKSTNDIVDKFDTIKKDCEDLIKEQCDNKNHHGPRLKKMALKVAKINKFDPNFSNFSSSQKKERKKMHDLAKDALAVGLTKAITQKKIFEDTCFIDPKTLVGTTERTFTTIMNSFFRGARDEKDIIEALNFIHTNKNNKDKADELKEKQEKVNDWFNGRIKDITKKINDFSYEKSDLEFINFFKDNGPFVLGATEFQGDNVKAVADSIGIKLDQKIYDEFKKVNHLMVDLGFKISDHVGNMANPLYPEFTKDDINKIENIISFGLGDLTSDEREFKDIVDYSTVNGFDSPFKQYFNNPGLIIHNFILYQDLEMRKDIEEGIYNIDNDNKLNPAEKEVAKNILITSNQNQKEKNIKNQFTTNIDSLKPYFNKMINERTNGEELSYSYNGNILSEFDGRCEAIKGNRVQVFAKSVDELGKPNGKYLFTLQVSNTGTLLPVNTGKPLEWNIDEAKEAANKSKQSAENKKQMFIDTATGKIKENLAKLYDNLKSGSRFWISSKGEYGQLMNQIDECRKGDFTNRKQLFERIDLIKKTASDYFMKRLDKTDRSDLAIQREEAVEKVLNTFGNEFGRIKEIEAEFDQKISKENTFVNKVKGNLKGLDQKELIDELDNTFSVGLDEFEKKQTSDIQKNFEKAIDENTYSKEY